MALWCAAGIAVIHTFYFLFLLLSRHNVISFHNILTGPNFRFILLHKNWHIPYFIYSTGFQLTYSIFFTCFLILWLYIHYYCKGPSRKVALIFSIGFIILGSFERFISPSGAFGDLWLIISPIILIPALGNRRAFMALLLNIALYHLLIHYGTSDYNRVLTSIATIFVAIFIMMMQLEYYRRELRLHHSAHRLRERALEIELIKENMSSGLMLLDPNLRVRPNYSDLCVKLLHKKSLKDQYFPSLLRQVIEENQYFTGSHTNYLDSDEYVISDLAEWEERIVHYFEMVASEQLDKEELASIDPLKYVKIYSYEGRSYISFQVSTIKMNEQLQYFMVMISNDTGKVAGRYRIREHEKKQLEHAQLLFALSHTNPNKQLESFQTFAASYLNLCKHILTDLRSNIPPQKLVHTVDEELLRLDQIFQDLCLTHYKQEAEQLRKACQEFLKTQAEHGSTIIDKATQAQYIELVVACEKFLSEVRSLFSIAVFFLREPQLHKELEKQKQALHYGLSQDTLQSGKIDDSYENQLSPNAHMFINLYTAFEMLLSEHDLQNDLKFIDHYDSKNQVKTK